MLHALHLRNEPPGVSAAEIRLDRQGDSVAVLAHALEALLDDSEHFVPLAFDDRAHRVQAVVQPAVFHNLQRSGDPGAPGLSPLPIGDMLNSSSNM
jgi:hypothetical protein